ncbi:MAG: hypothetical protein GWO11_08280, partial [Desulfuromonadales bacterium]|nr:hypothetical protein [Desulfuromonadales bacterium]
MPIGGEIVLTQKAEGGAIGADLAVIQGTNADQVALPAAAGERAKGITALKADAAGKAIPVVILGPAVATASAAVAAGSFVKIAGASGKLQAVGGEAAGTAVEVVGIALTSASADGDKFDLAVVPFR